MNIYNLDSNDYILLINFEAVLNESIYSNTVYVADTPTSERIHHNNSSDSESAEIQAWTTSYKFVYDIDIETKLDFSETNSVAVGNEFPPMDQPIILSNDSEPESKTRLLEILIFFRFQLKILVLLKNVVLS